MRLGLVACLVLLPACGADGSASSCSTLGEQCGGATDCYATCVCESGDAPACQDQCALPTDSPLLIDVSAWVPDSRESDLLALVNAARVAGGCCAPGDCFAPAPALTMDASLSVAARRHAADMVGRSYFSHDSPEGLTPEDRIRAAGFRGCVVGEDLAASYASADEVLAAWLASTEHCENLFWPTFSSVGVALFSGPASGPGTAWVADFGG